VGGRRRARCRRPGQPAPADAAGAGPSPRATRPEVLGNARAARAPQVGGVRQGLQPCTCRGQSNSNNNSMHSVGWRGGSGCGGRCKSPSGVRPSRWRLCVRALAKQCFASKAPSPM
ncbi:hypothetical protein SM139_0181, partial [Stenotrophomonas maltophilia]